jgi:hypothetical protein
MSAASLPELLPAIEHDDDCESESEHEHEHEFGIARAEARYSEPFPLISDRLSGQSPRAGAPPLREAQGGCPSGQRRALSLPHPASSPLREYCCSLAYPEHPSSLV